MKKKFSSEAAKAEQQTLRRNVGRRKVGQGTSDSLRLFCAALMTSTALVGIAPQQAHAADKIIDGVQETINSPETFDKLIVGNTLPNSQLDIATGGDVTVNTATTIGKNGGSEGTVTISGAGSKLTTGSDNFLVGYNGTGTLNVLDGAEVSASGTVLVAAGGGTGTVTISGAGSRLTAENNTLIIGNNAPGELTIANGGAASAEDVSIGNSINSSGTVTVSGAGSSLVASGSVYLTNDVDATGTLTVSNGGVVEAGDTLFIARQSGSNGTLNIGAAAGQTAVAAGTVQGAGGGAATIKFGTGTGKIVFNHTDTGLDFNANITGNGDIDVFSGTTILSGTNNIGSGDITVEGGELKVFGTTEAKNVYAGKGAGSNGTVTVSGSGSTLKASARFDIGKAGTGSLSVLDGAYVDTGNSFAIGRDSTGVGTVTISGAGSKVVNGFATYIGESGTGTLTISDGGELDGSDIIFFGFAAGSSGTGTVTGTGSKLSAQNLAVGRQGGGTLTISKGGVVEAETAVTIASGADSTGTLNIGAASGETAVAAGTLQGAGGGAATINFGSGTGKIVFNHTDTGLDFNANVTGNGAIDVSSGMTILSGTNDIGSGDITAEGGELKITGTTKADDVYIGKSVGKSGTVTISGNGSKLTTVDDVYVGFYGQGTLNVLDGGEVSAGGDLYVGTVFGSAGTVTVSGTGSSLTVDNNLILGTARDFLGGVQGGDNTLSILDGGEAAANEVRIGATAGTSDTVTVSGSGSKLNAVNDIRVGVNGTGTLNVASAGLATAEDILVGQSAGGTGTVTVSGAGSKLTSSDEFLVGLSGTGKLTLSDGGEATAGDNFVAGSGSGSTGTVNVSGTGSKLSSGNDFFVGQNGNGTLTISEGGEVVAGDIFYAGFNSGSVGTVTISGSGSKLTTGRILYLGYSSGSSGSLTVSGAGAMVISDGLELGRGDTTLKILDGGEITTTDQVVIGAGTAAATISGSGSKLTVQNSRDLRVADVGTATLDITNGGKASAGDVVLSRLAGATATVTVSGSDSKLTAEEQIYVSQSGTGTLTVSSGGMAEAGNKFTIAQNSGSTGTLNIGAASGETAMAAGTLQGADGAAANIVFGAGTGMLVFNHTETDYDFGATVSGSGTITNEAGFTSLTGNFSGFTGTGEITGGILSVDTTFGQAVNVRSGGTLTGSGTTGNIDFASGSFYQATIGGNGFITSTGTATIDTGSQVNVEFGDISTVAIWKPIEILTAATITGEFGSTNQDNYLFLNFDLSYDPTSVFLTLSRNAASFADFAQTPNQVAVANVVNVLPNGNELYDAFAIQKDAAAIPGILDQLTGEAHASTQSIVIQDTGTFRDIIGNRINAAFATAGTGATSQVSTNGPGDGQQESLPGGAIWGQAYGSFGRLEGNNNAADVKRSAGGLVAGVERNDFFGFNAGILAGFGRTDARVDDRSSDADIDSYTIGAYAGRAFGPVLTQVGTTFTWNDISSKRNVSFPGFTDRLTASYNSRTFQAFGEVGYAFGTPYGMLEPFAGLAVVHLETDSFTETGGAAALSVNGSSQTLGVSTLGMRGSYQVGVLTDGSILTFNGALAWRHSFGDVTPSVTSAFAAGSQAFTVAGTPIDEDTALVEAGFNLAVLERADLSISYRGEFGQSAQDNSFNARLGIKF